MMRRAWAALACGGAASLASAPRFVDAEVKDDP
jgi:hypothetical protein